jgi:hypothetical protein
MLRNNPLFTHEIVSSEAASNSTILGFKTSPRKIVPLRWAPPGVVYMSGKTAPSIGPPHVPHPVQFSYACTCIVPELRLRIKAQP